MALPGFRRFTRPAPARGDTPPPADPVQELIDAIDDPLLVVAAGRVRAMNRAARAVLGDHVLDEDVRLAVRQPAAAAVLAGQEDGPVALTGLAGRERHWELSARPLGAERRLLRLVDRSAGRAAERMRVDFVANASHELRTPLATLIGFIETLEDANRPEDTPVRLRFLKIMADEARRMQRLIDDLMSLSRIEADRYSPPREQVDLAAVVAEACADIRAGRPDGGRIALDLAVAAAAMTGDRGQLSQLVHNIAVNALKYGHEDTPVEVRLAPAGAGRVRLSVTDRGDGIAAEHLPRLTERFYRADPGRSRAVGGTGLGLAIVKHIVERHRGRLDIASTLGVGTTVTVDLPLAGPPLA